MGSVQNGLRDNVTHCNYSWPLCLKAADKHTSWHAQQLKERLHAKPKTKEGTFMRCAQAARIFIFDCASWPDRAWAGLSPFVRNKTDNRASLHLPSTLHALYRASYFTACLLGAALGLIASPLAAGIYLLGAYRYPDQKAHEARKSPRKGTSAERAEQPPLRTGVSSALRATDDVTRQPSASVRKEAAGTTKAKFDPVKISHKKQGANEVKTAVAQLRANAYHFKSILNLTSSSPANSEDALSDRLQQIEHLCGLLSPLLNSPPSPYLAPQIESTFTEVSDLIQAAKELAGAENQSIMLWTIGIKGPFNLLKQAYNTPLSPMQPSA